jgi:alcohol dehydrogenase (cytochrome c)
MKKSVTSAAMTAALAAVLATPTLAQNTAPSSGAGNWPVYNGNSTSTRFSPLNEINTGNVQTLTVAWIHQPGVIGQGLMETPLVVDGVVYSIGSNDRVFALDGATGNEIWHYYPHLGDIVNEIAFSQLARGVAIGNGRVYIGTVDGYGIALDQKTGKEIWNTQLLDTRKCKGCNFTSPPVVAGKTLVYGGTGGELPGIGKILGVDPDTGKIIWTFEVLKDDPKSWGGDSRLSGGGGAWMPGFYDAQTNTVFYGTANPAPDYDWGNARPGDNLYTSSVVALDPDTGKLKWYHQEVPHDVWDYDAAAGQFMMIDHDGRRTLLHRNKGGFTFLYDPADGTIQNVWQFNKYVNWVKGIDPKTGDLIDRQDPKMGEKNYACPWLVGNWESNSYSPQTGLMYATAVEACMTIEIQKQPPETVPLSSYYFGGTPSPAKTPDGQAYSHLDARDPLTGKVAWQVNSDIPLYSSALSTGGDLVFMGDAKGVAHAYDAKTGKELWTFNLGSGIHGGPVTYEAGGHQYVVFPSGLGGFGGAFIAQLWQNMADYPQGATLVAFRLK